MPHHCRTTRVLLQAPYQPQAGAIRASLRTSPFSVRFECGADRNKDNGCHTHISSRRSSTSRRQWQGKALEIENTSFQATCPHKSRRATLLSFSPLAAQAACMPQPLTPARLAQRLSIRPGARTAQCLLIKGRLNTPHPASAAQPGSPREPRPDEASTPLPRLQVTLVRAGQRNRA